MISTPAGHEVFELKHVARDAAIAASLLFQYGCPVDKLRKALTRNSDGSASGPLAHALDLLAEGL